VGGRLSINNGQGLRMAALAGLGIILQPLELLDEDLASGRLVRVLPDYEAPPLPVHLLFSPDRRPTPKLRSFIDFVTATFG
jgi:DNA-binding transcriptional LysR family regulator